MIFFLKKMSIIHSFDNKYFQKIEKKKKIVGDFAMSQNNSENQL